MHYAQFILHEAIGSVAGHNLGMGGFHSFSVIQLVRFAVVSVSKMRLSVE